MLLHDDCKGKVGNCVLIDIDISRRGDVDIYIFIDREVENDPFYDYEDGFSSGGDFFRVFATGVIVSPNDKEELAQKIDDFVYQYDIDEDFFMDKSLKDEVFNGLSSILYHYKGGADGYKCKCRPVKEDRPTMRPRPR